MKNKRFSDRGVKKGRLILNNFFLKMNGDIQRALELGCGQGDDLLNLKTIWPKAELFGIEVDESKIETLKHKGIKTFLLDIEKDNLPFRDESLDTVFSNQVLEHTKNLFWIMHETSRCLRIGGFIIIGVPNLASLHNRIRLAIGLKPTSIKSASAHVRGFTKPDIINFLKEPFSGGYQLIDFKGSAFYPLPKIIADPISSIIPSMAARIYLLFQKKQKYNNEFLKYPEIKKFGKQFYLG